MVADSFGDPVLGRAWTAARLVPHAPHPRRPARDETSVPLRSALKSAAQRELASGKLMLDEPRPRVTRIAIRHRAKHGMLDQEILDVLAATVPTLTAECLIITGDGPYFSAGYDIEALHLPAPLGAADGLTAHPSNAACRRSSAIPTPSWPR